MKDAAGNNATLTHSAVVANSSYKVDTSVPTITSITSNTFDGTYLVGAVIDIIVNFSESVTLSGGNLVVTLETGTTDRDVIIAPFSNATSATGYYEIQSEDNSPDLTVKNIALSGGSITDGTNAMASFSVPAGQNLADSKDITVSTPVCGSGGVTRNTKDQITSDLVLMHNESNAFDDCTLNQRPFRMAFGGAPSLRLQSRHANAQYYVIKGQTKII
jgi:hypothetical protein